MIYLKKIFKKSISVFARTNFREKICFKSFTRIKFNNQFRWKLLLHVVIFFRINFKKVFTRLIRNSHFNITLKEVPVH